MNNCNCINATYTPPVIPPQEDENCCLLACSAVLPCDQGVGPCGETGQYDLSTLAHVTTGCSDTVYYFLVEGNDSLTDVSITPEGILSWTTQAGTQGKYFKILFKLACITDCGGCITKLETIGTFTVGVKDYCASVICVDGKVCDPCDGTCGFPVTDLETNNPETITDLIAINIE